MKINKILLPIITGAVLFCTSTLFSQEYKISNSKEPKREFRGAWIHTVGNQTFKTLTTDSLKKMFVHTLDELKSAGINAVIFQIRPQADAFYKSEYEPWSRFLTGEQGVAPTPFWDPLQFMIEECHKRGMELHAWCNPYRVTSTGKEQLHPNHLYFKNPEIFKRYGEQLYFDPGEPESISHTIRVIADVVNRYDIDAIHFDDYFYPYPIAFEEFHDDASFVKYANSQGFEYWQKADWRRNNVTTLIHKLSDTIKSIKPWVRFGISPFGIHRNLKDTPDGSGSNTNGLSNYEQLYADVPLWIKNGWIDYNVPQLYWAIGHPAADYLTLINWWSKSNFGRHLYIGQNIRGFEYEKKMRLMRELPNIDGSVWWPGWSIVRNSEGVRDSLKNRYQPNIALVPEYKHLDSIKPPKVESLKKRGNRLSWTHNSNGDPMQEAQFFVVYRFGIKDPINIDDSKYIVCVTNKLNYEIKGKGSRKFRYVVTALDRCRNESVQSSLITALE